MHEIYVGGSQIFDEDELEEALRILEKKKKKDFETGIEKVIMLGKPLYIAYWWKSVEKREEVI